MSTLNTAEWLRQIDAVRTNPSAIQRLSLSKLEQAMDGTVDIVDPNSPFMFLLESVSVNSAAAMIEAEALTRKLYPSMALTEQELYLHMSDADYAGRFASPARTTMSFLFEKNELYRRVVDTGVGSVRKLTIPRHTEITVAGVPFTMQYPIDIRLMAHGGLQVVYDVEKTSPLETLTTNLVDWTTVRIDGFEFIKIDVPISQFQISTHPLQLSLATGVNATFEFSDQFYYARVFYTQADGTYKEMRTTHTDQVFDPTKPTALLQVTKGRLNVVLPQVYLTTGRITTDLRIDIYTTRGPLDMILNGYQMNAFTARFIDLEKDDRGIYVAPLSQFSSMAVYSDKVVTGGSNALTFEELRERVMINALGVPDLPITNVQLTARLKDLGYDMVKNIDNVTNRQFIATRTMPRPNDLSVVAGAGCTIQTLSASMSKLGDYATVADNGTRLTLLPSTLYRTANGVLEIVPDSEVTQLLTQPVDVRARFINESSYLYSPFHYVLDMTDNQFDLRAYFLDQPVVDNKSYVAENDTTGIAVATGEYAIERVINGYKLTVITRSTESWKEYDDDKVFCQLSYRPTGEKDRAYLDGTLVGTLEDGERVYEFILGTNFDIDAGHNILLNTFQMYNNVVNDHPVQLLADFDIVYAASGLTVEGLKNSDIDLAISRLNLPNDTIGISRERLAVRLGESMENLWHSNRSVVSSLDYERYTANVPALYEETIYERDETGAIVMTVDNGNVTFNILHNQGDPVLDENDDPVYKHRIGDVKLDPDGVAIVKNSRTLLREIDLFLVDGVYWFATANQALNYRASLPATVVDWVNGDIANVSRYLLEQTNLFFYPKSTLGQIAVSIMEDQRTTMAAPQSFSVTYYLRGVAFRDAALRQQLTRMTVETIHECLQKATVTLSDIIASLTAKAGADAISVYVEGLGGDLNLATVSLIDDSARLSIKKVAVALADGTISVEDDVDIQFLQHTQN